SRVQTFLGATTARNSTSTTKQDDAYRWDPAGNITAIVDQTLRKQVATCFTYDGLARLTHAWTTKQTDCTDTTSAQTHDGPAGFNLSWTYSGDGNITSTRTLDSTRKHTYADPAHPHAVTKAGNDSFSYDANGAMRTRDGAHLTWNAQHQLKSVDIDHH